MSVNLPQLDAPFAINRNGPAVVEQGSVGEIAANVYNIAVCPQGYRDELPEYGLPQLTRTSVPIDLERIKDAILQYEPEADLELSEVVDALQNGLNDGGVDITIEVS